VTVPLKGEMHRRESSPRNKEDAQQNRWAHKKGRGDENRLEEIRGGLHHPEKGPKRPM